VALAAEDLAPELDNSADDAHFHWPKLVPSWSSSGIGLATGLDGSIVVARGNLLLRYRPDGQLDDAFGDGGRLAIYEIDGLPFYLQDVAIDPQGKTVIFGTTVDPSVARMVTAYTSREVSPSFATVLRLDGAGELDRSFGGGDGVFRNGLALRPAPNVPDDIPLVEIASAKVDSEGRPVMAIGEVGFPPSIRSTPGWAVESLARLTPAGDLDPSFGGGDGIVEGIARPGWLGRTFNGFCISAGNAPVVAIGQFTLGEEGERPAGWLSRLREDGSPDRTFGKNGTVRAAGGAGPLACPRSGHVLMLQDPGFVRPASRSPSPWRVVRRTPTGGVNRRFGRRAQVNLRGRNSWLSSLTQDRRGRVLLAGTLSLPKQGGKGERRFFTVIRLLPSGRVDRGFGHGGWVRTGFGPDADVYAEEAVADASGRLVVAGSGRAPWLQPGGVLLAGYLPGR